jgi:hypothetical protein
MGVVGTEMPFTIEQLTDSVISLLDELRSNLRTWNRWDAITHLVHYRSTTNCLWEFLYRIKQVRSNSRVSILNLTYTSLAYIPVCDVM